MSSSDRFGCRISGRFHCPTRSGHTSRKLAILAAATLTVTQLSSPLFGQARPPAAAPAGAPAVAAVPGLDGLSDKTVMGELAGRDLNSLLNRLFDEKKIPEAERTSIRSLQAIKKLGSAGDLTEVGRVSLLKASVEGLNSLKATFRDPKEMSDMAITLVSRGIEPDVNILDYWGDDSVRQARVGPAADLAVELIDKASKAFRAEATRLEGQLKTQNDPKIKLFEEADLMANKSAYAAQEWTYYRLLGIDVVAKKAKPPYLDRVAIAAPVIKYLTDPEKGFDNNDSQFAPAVKILLGKIYMRTGEFAKAKEQFSFVIRKKIKTHKGKEVDISPEPVEQQINTAKYFSAVCDVLAGKPDDAQKEYDELVTWQKGAKSNDFIQFRDSTADKAQLLMLNYRIAAAKADLAPAAQKPKLNEAADAVLGQLAGLGDEFKALVNEQLINKLKDKKVEDIKWAEQSVPLLQALMARGYGEWAKPEGTPIEADVLARGLRAAEELSSRKIGAGGLTASQVESAKLHAALFLHKQGKLAAAADKFLDYATDPLYARQPNVPKAMDQAEALSIQAYTKDRNDPEAVRVYDRMLKVGSNPPFSRLGLTYYYADRLRVKGDYEEAIKQYAKIPQKDKNEADARYWQLICTERVLAKLPTAQKKPWQESLLAQAATVRTISQAQLAANPQDATAVSRAKFRLAKATLTEAELATQMGGVEGAKRSIQVLQNFEANTTGLPQADALNQAALFMRAKALIKAGQFGDAIKIVETLGKDPKTADSAVGMVTAILKELGEQAKKARAENRTEDLQKILSDRANMAPLLLPVVERQPPEKRDDMRREILFFEAAAKTDAAEVLPPGPEKDQRYKESLAVYKDKILPDLDKLVEKFTKLKAEKPKDEAIAKSLKDYEDRQTAVTISIAKCQYELKDYLNSSTTYAGLLQFGKLGAQKMLVTDATGQVVGEEDNPDYWDGMYRLNMARYLYAQANPNDDTAKKMLTAAKQTVMPLFSVNSNVGGAQYKEKFLDLRQKLDPNAPPLNATTQPAGTTQPATPAPPTAPATPASPGTPAATAPSAAK
jgi:hypothetical protein